MCGVICPSMSKLVAKRFQLSELVCVCVDNVCVCCVVYKVHVAIVLVGTKKIC